MLQLNSAFSAFQTINSSVSLFLATAVAAAAASGLNAAARMCIEYTAMIEFSTGFRYPHRVAEAALLGTGRWSAADRAAIEDRMWEMQHLSPSLHPVPFHGYPATRDGTARLLRALERTIAPADYDYAFLACVYHQLGYAASLVAVAVEKIE